MLGLKLNHVSKRGHWSLIAQLLGWPIEAWRNMGIRGPIHIEVHFPQTKYLNFDSGLIDVYFLEATKKTPWLHNTGF